MAEKTRPMTIAEMRKAVEAGETDRTRINSIVAEQQRKIDRLDRVALKESVYTAQVNAVREETSARVSAVLGARQSFDVLSAVLGQKTHWTVDKYLHRAAVMQSNDVARETALARIVMQMQYLDGEGLAALGAAALSNGDTQLAAITWQALTGRLRNPPEAAAERDALIAAKTQLELADNYSDVQTTTALTREADELYTALVDTARYASGLTQTFVHELNPDFFDDEQKRRWNIPDKAA
jgi:hypothetical protein